MTEVKFEDKFLVFNMKFVNALSEEGNKHLIAVCEELSAKFPHAKDNKYYVCNQDEPYAKKVIKIILDGEIDKERKKLEEEIYNDYSEEKEALEK